MSVAHTPGSIFPSGRQTPRSLAACFWACCRAFSADTQGRPSLVSGSRSHQPGFCGSSHQQSHTFHWALFQWCSGSSGPNETQTVQILRDSFDFVSAGMCRCPCWPAPGSPLPPPWWRCRRRTAMHSLCQPCCLLDYGSFEEVLLQRTNQPWQ